MSLRQLKKAQTRAALADAAAALSLERGFDAVTVEQIAEAAGVSRRTFFRYFDCKEAAFFAEQGARLEAFRAALSRPRAGEGRYRRVRRCLLELGAEYDADRPALVARHDTIQASRALIAWDLQMDRAFEAAIADALTPPGASEGEALRSRVQAAATFGVVRAVLRAWFVDPAAPPLVSLGARALDLLEEGLGERRGEVIPLPEPDRT